MSPRRALWSPTTPASAADGQAVRESPAAPTVQQGAPAAPLPVRSAAPLPGGSALAAQVKLARLSDVLVEAAGILRELSQETLELRAETRDRTSVEMTTTPARLLSVRDVAERLNLSERTVRRLRQRGDLPRGIAVAGVVRWRPEEIDAWIGGQR